MLLIQHVKRLYQESLKKFPYCTVLRIDYSGFLLTFMHNKKEALNELLTA